ncbi:PAS domain-containing protein, partial [Phenylobacterium sp.]|uniref:PAS domain-containing protein n=1 Tax=Phenylobacterium sp. TaxID=1871053 RepID=UPI002FD91AFC
MAAQIGASAAAARAHEEIYGYWAGLRRGARLPARGDIEPVALKRLLPTVSLIDVSRDPLDFRIRLAGTGLYGVYGREITGRSLTDVYNAAAADYWRSELSAVVEERRPGVG